MQEGDVVMVVGNLDDRIRNNDYSPRVGTIVSLDRDEVLVLLPDGILWKGLKREIVLIKEERHATSND